MSTVPLSPPLGLSDEVGQRMRFLQKLQAVSNKIHATGHVDEIMLDLAEDICGLFHCERMTLYALSPDQANGYKGRVGLHELMAGSDTVKRLIHDHAPASQLLSTVLEEGMTTLKMDGIEKVLSGATDMKQVRAVCIK